MADSDRCAAHKWPVYTACPATQTGIRRRAYPLVWDNIPVHPAYSKLRAIVTLAHGACVFFAAISRLRFHPHCHRPPPLAPDTSHRAAAQIGERKQMHPAGLRIRHTGRACPLGGIPVYLQHNFPILRRNRTNNVHRRIPLAVISVCQTAVPRCTGFSPVPLIGLQ